MNKQEEEKLEKSEKPEEKKETEKKPVEEEKGKKEEKGEETKEKPVEEKKKKVIKIKKTEALVNDTSIPISTKHSIYICKFIKGKKIEDAINDLEQVILKKKAVPMKGEIPHRKGMMSGRYPKKAAEHFIKILKRLTANATVNGLENPVITEAIANFGSRPYGRFGRVRKKRTHLKIIVKEKKEDKKRKKIKKELIKSVSNKEVKKT
ncbi:MAG: hypothetical protein IIA85_02735 [Nanoarchaeota archaeon]|nr:hypothetical protein [Nanoarchaeota archaeon]